MTPTLQLPYHPAGWQKLVQRLFGLRPVSAMIAPIAHRLDAPFIRLSHGKTTLTSLLTGLPVVTLTTTGAKSGLPRTVPLVAIPIASDVQRVSPAPYGGASPEARGAVILVASNFGRTHHPAWYYNLRLNPLATLTVKGTSGRYVAHEATGDEREACWQMAALLYGGYNAYRRRASHRQIGVFILTPLEEDVA
jgi:deazaflavin-dependent oxidoreductase (nitroreductase family)